MIDLHTHVLPGVDDGSPNQENSVRVLERMVADGVTELACTPHLKASRAPQAPVAEHTALLESLRVAAPPGIKLHRGFEIMLDCVDCDLSDPALAIAGTKTVLVEFPRGPLPLDATDQLLRLRTQGLRPLIAHPERYRGISFDKLYIWRDLGAVLQGDALMLLSSGKKADFSRKMLELGLMDILASDNHGDRRSLQTVRLWLSELGGEKQTRILTQLNPAHLLAGEALVPVPPLKERRGIWQRLTQLFSRTPDPEEVTDV